MTAFEYEGVKITLKPANGLNRIWLNRLRNLYPGYFDLPTDEQGYVEEMLHLLYLVDSVTGELGFPIPTNGTSTPDTVEAFVDGMFRADEELYVKWKVALHDNRKSMKSDPDLLPPQELNDDQKKIRSPKKSEDTSDST